MDLFAIASSGMQAATAQLNASANNIANLDTPGYQAQRVDLVSLSGGGVAVGDVQTDHTPGPTQSDGAEGSNVNFAGELLNMTRARLLYSANAAVIKVGQQMTGSLLDMFDSDHH
jgi:flagellar hook protein FlgE